MLTFRDIVPEDRQVVLPMVQIFYQSDAVDHAVSMEILERSFDDAADPTQPMLRGVLLLKDGAVAGYMYLTFFYAAEVAGMCVMIEEIFVDDRFRGQGLGSEALRWVTQEYPQAKRFRLEVTESNQGAIKLYERCGYEYLRYGQMVYDMLK